MLHKIQHAHFGGVLHGARPGWICKCKMNPASQQAIFRYMPVQNVF